MPRSWDSIVTVLESAEGHDAGFTSYTVIARITPIAHCTVALRCAGP